MLERGGELDLAEEAFRTESSGEFGIEHLEPDRAIVLDALGQIDRGHAIPPELALKRVAIG